MEKVKWVRVYIACRNCGAVFVYKHRISCQHCQEAHYCSTKCLQEDQNVHQNICSPFRAETRQISTDASSVESRTLNELLLDKNVRKSKAYQISDQECFKCKKKCDKSISCVHCGVSYYCSNVCQEQSIHLHKSSCELKIVYFPVQISCRTLGNGSGQALMALFSYLEKILFSGQTFQMLKTKGLTEKKKASPLFGNLVHELAPTFFAGPFFSAHYTARPVIYAQIVSPYPHSWRYAVIAMDVMLNTIPIIFHDEQRTDATITGGPNIDHLAVTKAPLSSCLKPGNFIILLDAWLHNFRDATVGVRIDDLEKVHFFWSE
ncbi:hypothetical protein Bpfe_010818 [Biomphalaria pfeifferi]|uniref:MYND-type domain-containing protein n=1 Tax=Biomphalaria pfeifferi TaxID=112525 RepID=A0AAD8BS32_BIOPF|nr:hypothetical protein Bpfe_010818 [Biomphalaria pfeifferi]